MLIVLVVFLKKNDKQLIEVMKIFIDVFCLLILKNYLFEKSVFCMNFMLIGLVLMRYLFFKVIWRKLNEFRQQGYCYDLGMVYFFL